MEEKQTLSEILASKFEAYLTKVMLERGCSQEGITDFLRKKGNIYENQEVTNIYMLFLEGVDVGIKLQGTNNGKVGEV